MSRHTIDIIKEVVTGMTFQETVRAKDPNGSNFIYTLCDTHWLKDCAKIQVNGMDYRLMPPLDSMDPDTQILTSGDFNVGDVVNGFAPVFQSGTPRQASVEVSQITDWKQRLPMAYLLEIIRERFNKQETEKVHRTSSVFIYFVDSLPNGGKIEDIRRLVVEPMEKLAQEFVNELQEHPSVISNLLNEYQITSFNHWGVFVDRQGTTMNIFPENLAGVELEITIPFFKDCACKKCKN